MALNANDIELIRASWVPARKDPSSSGALLFKGLFTKFPDYLKFFSQFVDLDIETLHENKRLLKHAIKVIDTVTFLVDSIGDETKATQLNEALVNLIRGHLKRKIGLAEFRNLGIVIIDFICDLQQRQGRRNSMRLSSSLSNSNDCSNCRGGGGGGNQHHSLESAPSEEAQWSSEQETDLESSLCTQCQTQNHHHHHHHHHQSSDDYDNEINQLFHSNTHHQHRIHDQEPNQSPSPTLDANQLVTAWTKLYSSILELVQKETSQQQITDSDNQ